MSDNGECAKCANFEPATDTVSMHLMVGEIRSDVKWLRKQYEDQSDATDGLDKRLRKQERKSSWMMGAGLILAALCAKVGMPDLTAGLFH